MAGRNTLKQCLDCGRLSYKPRCGNCMRAHEKAYKKTARPAYDYKERKRREAAVAAHRKDWGEVCFGWRRKPHPTSPDNPLTADHVKSVAAGGLESGELSVLCRSCNSAKGATFFGA